MLTRALLIGCAGLALFSGLQTWRVDRLKAETVTLKIENATLTQFKALAITDADLQAKQCAARVADARASARRIETIVERPYAVDPSGCPVRATLDADSLRDALQPVPPTP